MLIIRIITALYALFMFILPIFEMKRRSTAYEYHIVAIILSIILMLFALFGSWTTFVVAAISIFLLYFMLAIVRGVFTGYFKWRLQLAIWIVDIICIIWILQIF